jgi:two-component system response regulator VanR
VKIRIIVVEDDPNIRAMLEKFLTREGYNVDTCANGEIALGFMHERRYDLVILDIMLPGLNGQEILKELRRAYDMPVLMMTALSDEDNQLRAFENEADDYVTKPFPMRILLRRAEALLRRSGALKADIRAGRITLLPMTCSIHCSGETISLTPHEFEILKLLAVNKNRVITHEILLTRIWGHDFEGNEEIIRANIRNLRGKLPGDLIRTVKGIGYCLEASDDDI